VETVFYQRSGLLAISGSSSDMRELLSSDDASAQLAVDYFVHRAACGIGAMAAVLGGLDALVFTAGIGEHSIEVRRRICRASAWLGIELDDEANRRHSTRISKPLRAVSAWTIPTNEELTIARHTVRLLGLG
ncbi:MAG: acetate kinase, partial [Gammaproteobacteria bacterium]|nr:acetate kinase [Gammaproteobacteria bacterium]